MAKMPRAKQVPLASRMTQPRMTHHDIVCIHTMVGSLAGTRAMFKQSGYKGTESHFGTDAFGTTEQWVDTDYSADANYRGSRRVISIENADHGPGFKSWNTRGDNVPPFTAAQIEANAQIIAWAHKVHGIPIKLIPDTKPGRRGVGYHAQGVPGNGLVRGGISWSKARGKVCPGRRRIAQIPQIIKRAQEIAGGKGSPVTKKGSDMKLIGNSSNGADRVIKPGQTARIKAGKYFSLATLAKGQEIIALTSIQLKGVFENETIQARYAYVDYVKNGKPQDKILGYESPVDLNGSIGGKPIERKYVEGGKLRHGARKGGSLRLQLQIHNPTDHDIVIGYTTYNVWGN